MARCQITNVSVGVAAKDAAEANCLDLSIHNYRAHAAMTYNKKDFYETASMRISGPISIVEVSHLFARMDHICMSEIKESSQRK